MKTENRNSEFSSINATVNWVPQLSSVSARKPQKVPEPATYDYEDCSESFMSEVMLPLTQDLEARLPRPESMTARVINRLFGLYDFTNSAKEDFCSGKLSTRTAWNGAKLITKGAVGVFSVQVGVAIGAAGLAVSGPIGLLAGLGAGTATLVGGTYLADKALEGTKSAYKRVVGAIGDYVSVNR